MSDFNPPKWTQPPTPEKKVSHRFFTPKTRFVTIMLTTPFFGVSRFMFSKLPRTKGKMDIFKCPNKCPKIGGLIPSFILAFGGFKRNIFDGFIFET